MRHQAYTLLPVQPCLLPVANKAALGPGQEYEVTSLIVILTTTPAFVQVTRQGMRVASIFYEGNSGPRTFLLCSEIALRLPSHAYIMALECCAHLSLGTCVGQERGGCKV